MDYVYRTVSIGVLGLVTCLALLLATFTHSQEIADIIQQVGTTL